MHILAIHDGTFVKAKIVKFKKINTVPVIRPPSITPAYPYQLPKTQAANDPSTTTPPIDRSVYPHANKKHSPHAIKVGKIEFEMMILIFIASRKMPPVIKLHMTEKTTIAPRNNIINNRELCFFESFSL